MTLNFIYLNAITMVLMFACSEVTETRIKTNTKTEYKINIPTETINQSQKNIQNKFVLKTNYNKDQQNPFIKKNSSLENEPTPIIKKNGDINAIQDSNKKNTTKNQYKMIPVEVRGIPYQFDDIRGNHKIDYIISTEYDNVNSSQQAKFKNFMIKKMVYDFQKDGSLIFKTYRSWEKTAITKTSFYPAVSEDIKNWNLPVVIHNHEKPCSQDRYDEIAIAQAELYKMVLDPELNKIYSIFLSVAEDMDYDYNKIGVAVKFVSPQPLIGVCEDYANLLVERLEKAKLAKVTDIKINHGQHHAWVTLKYQNKILYLDPTWFDKNVIDNTGTVVHKPYKDPRHFTFNNDTFTNHNKHHLTH